MVKLELKVSGDLTQIIHYSVYLFETYN